MTTTNIAAEKAALKEADIAWLAVSKDAKKFVAATDPEFKFFPPAAPFLSNREAIEDHWNAIVTTPGLKLTWEQEGAEVSTAGDLGHIWGFFRLTTLDENQAEVVTTGKCVFVMRKQTAGHWAPLIDIFNDDC